MNSNLDISPQELDLIEQYLDGQLPGEERSAFEQRMATDPGWREKIREVQLLAVGIREASVEKLIDGLHKDAPAVIRKMHIWKKLVAAAVVILVAGGLIWWLGFQQPVEQRLFSSYFKPEPGLPTTMSRSENYVFENAMVEYKTGNYKKAIESWEQLEKNRPGNDTLHYFIGVALLADNDPANSVSHLDQVIATGKETFLYDAYWYKGLGLLKLNKKQDAIQSIQLSRHPKAAELIQKIEQ